MKRKIALLLFAALFGYLLFSQIHAVSDHPIRVRSIDTMKYSRDQARTKLNDPSYDAVIDNQMKQIAALRATHVAIGTPYDKEFLPVLKQWVSKARKYGLHVWFRGNFSGWEGWFEYSKMDKDTHTREIEKFILANKSLFENGDIFTSCPECENGALGDPRYGDVVTYRKFLVTEYSTIKNAFTKIGKKVIANYYSMNGDVALLVMDKNTTKALGGVVTIDHYVKTPGKLVEDIKDIAIKSGGKVVLGEIGVPIPDIHGKMTEWEQAEWIAATFAKLQRIPYVVGVNYWVNVGGSTALWTDGGSAKKAVSVLKNAYSGNTIRGKVTDASGKPVSGARVVTLMETYETQNNGEFIIPYFYEGQSLQVSAEGFRQKAHVTLNNRSDGTIVLSYSNPAYGSEKGIITKIIWILTSPFRFIMRLLTNS